MPRQLPWVPKGSNVKAKGRVSNSKPSGANNTADDDFFDGTVLASTRKRKQATNLFESDDDLPELPKKTYLAFQGPKKIGRALSSSPPPALTELPRPKLETMREGLNRFDLRDDEWMMVEDEFLQTAKLFTRHLHLAEYERLKAIVKTKKGVVRPVVKSCEPSEQRRRKMKAEKQAKAQRRALKDALSFNSSGKDDFDDMLTRPNRDKPVLSTSTGRADSRGPSKTRLEPLKSMLDDSESEDLNVPIRSKRVVSSPPKSFERSSNPDAHSRPFVKPASPATSRPSPSRFDPPTSSRMDQGSSSRPPSSPTKSALSVTSRRSRLSLAFDDGFPSTTPSTTRLRTTTSHLPTTTRKAVRTTALHLDDDDSSLVLSKGAAERMAKRKAEAEKARKENEDKDKKRKDRIDLNDIPTFLF